MTLKEIVAEINIAIVKKSRFKGGINKLFHLLTMISSLTAIAAPLLGLRIINKTAVTKNAQAVLTADNVINVCFLSVSPLAVMAITVPVAEVIPGMIETSIPARLPVIIEINVLAFSLITGFSTICSGILGLVIYECIRVGIPNNPANVGNRIGAGKPIGEHTLILFKIMPNTPDNMKTKAAMSNPKILFILVFLTLNRSIFAFSVVIIIIEIAIKTHGIILLRIEYKEIGSIKANLIGYNSKMERITAPKLPKADKYTPSYPRPFNKRE